MKISFDIKSSRIRIQRQKPFNISYEDQGNFCNIILYGDINNPQVVVIPFDSLYKYSIPRNCKYLFSMNISWSKLQGFEYVQYSDPKINTKINDYLCPRVGSLNGKDKIQINRDLLTLTLKVQVNQKDLSENNSKNFLEVCSTFGIKVFNLTIDDCNIEKGNFSSSQLTDVTFINCQSQGVNFKESYLNNIKFINSNLQQANFSNSQLDRVDFYDCDLEKSIFDSCQVDSTSIKREKNEVISFEKCNLTASNFINGSICGDFIESDLSQANFSQTKLVACQFYNCILNQTIYIKSNFRYLDKTEYITRKKQSKYNQRKTKNDIRPCSIKDISQTKKLTDCDFNEASIKYVELNNNRFIDTNFQQANLEKSNISNCEFDNCNLDEANFSQVRMIKTNSTQCNFTKAIFYRANLRESTFTKSDLIGVDFRYADLTLLNLNKCHLNFSNFFQTKRGGINLNIENFQEEDRNKDKQQIDLKSNCTIKCIEWNPQLNGEIQIDEISFLEIIAGLKSPVSVISNLAKGNAQFVLQNYAQATAAGRDYNDTSVNVDGDVNDGKFETGNINESSVEDVEDVEDLEEKTQEQGV
jgi:uncharacterized protein YjbI with pentapeptide repeats